jgi:hypothetical protein
MLMQHLERPRTAARLKHIPAWMPQLAMNPLAEPDIRADNKHIGCSLMIVLCEGCDGRSHNEITSTQTEYLVGTATQLAAV